MSLSSLLGLLGTIPDPFRAVSGLVRSGIDFLKTLGRMVWNAIKTIWRYIIIGVKWVWEKIEPYVRRLFNWWFSSIKDNPTLIPIWILTFYGHSEYVYYWITGAFG